MDLRTQIDTYNEKMLKLQFEASEGIEHKLTKGELREQFLKKFFREELTTLEIRDGILAQGDWQSSQADFLVLKKDARVGNMSVYDASDCQLFMEVKSRAVASELILLDKHAKELKDKNEDIIVGMFSYASRAKRKTIISSFGFPYDKDMDLFDEYDESGDKYPSIDFYYNLNADYEGDGEYAYCIIKNTDGQKTLFLKTPVIGDLVNIFKRTIQ